eukprot:1156549-Pelagomonas_calceolata.AAC.1
MQASSDQVAFRPRDHPCDLDLCLHTTKHHFSSPVLCNASPPSLLDTLQGLGGIGQLSCARKLLSYPTFMQVEKFLETAGEGDGESEGKGSVPCAACCPRNCQPVNTSCNGLSCAFSIHTFFMQAGDDDEANEGGGSKRKGVRELVARVERDRLHGTYYEGRIARIEWGRLNGTI